MESYHWKTWNNKLFLKPISFAFNRKIEIFANPHFWAIALILGTLSIFHYGYLFGINQMPLLFRQIALFAYDNDVFNSIFVIPILYASYIFRISGAMITSLIMTAVLLTGLLTETYPSGIAKTTIFIIVLFLASIFVAIAANRTQREKEAFKELEKNRQAYLSRLLQVQEKERQRIALELHDDVVQTSLGMANMVQGLLINNSANLTSEQRDQAEQIKAISIGICEHLKKLSRELRPSILDHLGLLPAIHHIVNEFNRGKNIKLTLTVKGAEHRLPVEDEVHIFRIIQEALTNIKRHSQATTAGIAIDFRPDDFLISIWDNGKGIDLPERVESLASTGKLGLIGMCERARLAHVSINIKSELDQGTFITLKRQNNRSSD